MTENTDILGNQDFSHPEPLASLSFVLLEEEEPEPAGFASILMAELPDATVNVDDAGMENSEVITVEFDEATIYISAMPAPVPGQEAENAAKNNVIWDAAEAEVAKHKSHLLLAAMPRNNQEEEDSGAGKGGGGGCGCGGCSCGGNGQNGPDARWDALAGHLRMAEVIVALCQASGCLGVFFPQLNVVYEPNYCREVMDEAIEEGTLPLPLLTYLAGTTLESGGNIAFSYGLRNLGYEEMECAAENIDVEGLYGFLFNVINYVLTTGTLLKPGETLGYTEYDEEKSMQVSLVEGTFVEGRVLRIAPVKEAEN